MAKAKSISAAKRDLRGYGSFWQIARAMWGSVKTAGPCSRQWEPFYDLDQKQIVRCVLISSLGECRRSVFGVPT
jgi:hypothetical protein